MTQQPSRPLTPFDLPAATHSYLQRAAISLHEAMTAREASLRYACAHVAALRATAALIAARATPTGTSRRGRQKNAWVLLAEIAPELSEWAAFFSAGAAKRAAAEAGSRRENSDGAALGRPAAFHLVELVRLQQRDGVGHGHEVVHQPDPLQAQGGGQ